MKKGITYLVSILLTLVLIASLCVTQIAAAAQFVALKPETCTALVEEKQVTDKVCADLQAYYQTQENASGIPASVYAESIAPDAVRGVIDETITAAFAYLNGERDSFTVTPDFSVLEKSLTSFFETYAEENGAVHDDAYEKSLNQAIDAAKTNIRLSADVFCFGTLADKGVLEKARTVMPWVRYVLIFSALLDVMIFAILLMVHHKAWEEGLYHCSNALLVGSLLPAAPAVWLRVTHWFDRFAVKADAVFAAVTGYLYHLTDVLILTAGAMGCLAVVGYVIFAIARAARKRREGRISAHEARGDSE